MLDTAHLRDAGQVLRDLTTDDAAAIAAIARAARQAAIPGLPDLHSAAEDVDFYAAEIASSRGAGWATDSGEMAGFVLWRADQVEHLYVHPEHWRRGIGTQLLDEVLAAAGGREVRLWTFQANDIAHAFYLGRGFRVVGSTDGSGNEERLSDHLMALRPDRPEHPPGG